MIDLLTVNDHELNRSTLYGQTNKRMMSVE